MSGIGRIRLKALVRRLPLKVHETDAEKAAFFRFSFCYFHPHYISYVWKNKKAFINQKRPDPRGPAGLINHGSWTGYLCGRRDKSFATFALTSLFITYLYMLCVWDVLGVSGWVSVEIVDGLWFFVCVSGVLQRVLILMYQKSSVL